MKYKVKKGIEDRCDARVEINCQMCTEGSEVILSGKVDEQGDKEGYFVGQEAHCWFKDEWIEVAD